MPTLIPDDLANALLAEIDSTDDTRLSPSLIALQRLLHSASTPTTSSPGTSPPFLWNASSGSAVSWPDSERLQAAPDSAARAGEASGLGDTEGFPRTPHGPHATTATTCPTALPVTTGPGLCPSCLTHQTSSSSTATSPTSTLRGSPPDPFMLNAVSDSLQSRRFLSPLRLSHKRLWGDVDEEDDEEQQDLTEEEKRLSQERLAAAARSTLSNPHLMAEAIRRSNLSCAASLGYNVSVSGVGGGIGGGDGGGGGGGGGGGPPAYLWTPDCNRHGDRERMGQSANIGSMPCNDSGCEDCEHHQEESQTRSQNNTQSHSRKAPRLRTRNISWTVDPNGAPVTLRAGRLLSGLLNVFSIANRHTLDILLSSPDASLHEMVLNVTPDIPAIVTRLKLQSKSAHFIELLHMVTLVQLALSINCLQQTLIRQGGKKLSRDDLADRYAAGTPGRTFSHWHSAAKRLLVLCGAGTVYILPIIAVMGMRSKITGAETAPQDIVSLANALREVRHGQWFSMVQRFMIPVNYIRTHPGYIQHLKLIHNPPDSQGQQTPVVLSFCDEEKLDTVFDSIETQTYRLPARSEAWSRALPSWPQIQPANQVVLPQLRKIKTPLQLQKIKSPVTKSNRNQVTERERKYASKAIPVTSIKDLEDKLAQLHSGGKTMPGRYIEINSQILNGEALHISDRDNKLVALLFTVPEEYRQMLIHALEHIHAVMPGELKDDDSTTAFFRYLSIHYVWYARFGESGKGSPASVHPDHLKKPNKGKVNVQQRMPRQSKELRENHEEYALLADAFADFFDLIRVALKAYLPEQYDEIKIVAESLPMGGGKSPAYPFTGFVLNISSCTWAHRDRDKIMCFVIPLDKFIGGQLGQIETGFCFDLQMGDVLAFPSCDITHFNCHFTGRRVTLVLHTDPKGDAWAKDCNGWAAHVVRNTEEGGTSGMEA